ncbi:MAG: metal-sensitive transcriptional regulator [Gemmatimonadota bacterium]|nr:metal-sensitive transcriptional regulator [Gemmatimonadota bacterium]
MPEAGETTTRAHGYQRAGTKDALTNRLRRIEGQVRGLQKMLEEGRYCVDVLTQIDAVTAALARVQDQILESHIHHCVADALSEGADPVDRDRKVDEVVTLLKKFRRS